MKAVRWGGGAERTLESNTTQINSRREHEWEVQHTLFINAHKRPRQPYLHGEILEAVKLVQRFRRFLLAFSLLCQCRLRRSAVPEAVPTPFPGNTCQVTGGGGRGQD